MWRWRFALTCFLVLMALPLLFCWRDLFVFPNAWSALGEWERLVTVISNSAVIVLGTLSLVLPLGIVLAVVLYRTDLPGRNLLRFLLLWQILIPLPLFATGWEIPLDKLEMVPGMPRAIWIHAVAAIPWVVLLVGQGLSWVEREIEEDALLAAPSWRVLLSVTLPRSSAAIGAAALWVALQTLTEITVTDRMVIRTFAEEVYLQLSRPEGAQHEQEVDELVAYALAVAAPSIPPLALLTGWAIQNWQRASPPLDRRSPPLLFRLGSMRLVVLGVVSLLIVLLLAAPIGALLWRAGLSGVPASWSFAAFLAEMQKVLLTSGGTLLGSLALAGGVGLLTTTLAWLALWAARDSCWMQRLLFVLAVLCWTVPGPVLGLGMKKTIFFLLDTTESRLLGDWLYYRPSPLPVIWVQTLQLLPFALALLWPVMRLVPRELIDAARVDGATPLRELRHVIAPLTGSAFGRCVLAIGALSLGELSASKLASIPGAQTYAEKLFIAMHAGMSNDLSAQSLWLLSLTLLPALCLWRSSRGPG